MDEETQEPGRVAYFSALLEAQKEAPAIPSTDKHYDGYMYASGATVKRFLVPILKKHGLTVELVAMGDVEDLELPTASKKVQFMTTLEAVFRVTHAASGHSEVYRAKGRRTNDKDKGIQHAVSSAEKTFLLRLLNTWESGEVEHDSAGVQETTGRARPVGRGGGKRRSPPEEPPPPKAPRDDRTIEAQLQAAKEDLKGSVRRGKLRLYHLDAVAETDPSYPDTLAEFGLDDYQCMRQLVERSPDAFYTAMLEMAKKYPSSDDRLRKLHDLIDKAEKVGSDERIWIAEAHQSNWSDAVEYWINILTERIRGQTEADV